MCVSELGRCIPGGCTECMNVCLCFITGDEAALKSLCWIPFGLKTLPIESQGGILYLQPPSDKLGGMKEDTVFVEVPPGAVDTSADVKMRYAIIPSGPFALPKGYQFGSPVVYIYYDGRRVTKPLKLHLPHWYGGEDCTRDGLAFAIAPHSLEAGKRVYRFQLIKGGTFSLHQQYGTVDIDGHSSLFAEVFKEKARSVYLATQCEQRLPKTPESHTKIVITFFSTMWLEVCPVYVSICCMTEHITLRHYVCVCVCVCVRACACACKSPLHTHVDCGNVLETLGNGQGHFYSI